MSLRPVRGPDPNLCRHAVTDPTRYSQAPIELPIDGWLYGVRPAPKCHVCTALNVELDRALKAQNWKRRSR